MVNSARIIPASIAAAALVGGITGAAWGSSAPAHHEPAVRAAMVLDAHQQSHPPGANQAVKNWYNKGGGKQKVHAVGAALSKIGTDAQTFSQHQSSGASTTTDLTNLSGDAGTLNRAAGALLRDLPPGASRSVVATGCHQLQHGAADIKAGVASYTAGDLTAATTQLNNAKIAITTAGANLSNAASIIRSGR